MPGRWGGKPTDPHLLRSPRTGRCERPRSEPRSPSVVRGRVRSLAHASPIRRSSQRQALGPTAVITDTLGWSRHQLEPVDVRRSYDGEVATVDGGDLGRSQSLGDSNDQSVDRRRGAGLRSVRSAPPPVRGRRARSARPENRQRQGFGGRTPRHVVPSPGRAGNPLRRSRAPARSATRGSSAGGGYKRRDDDRRRRPQQPARRCRQRSRSQLTAKDLPALLT